ncbi:hypothetical protein TUMEXPCC7403_15135 [Tumidithrix helvetica PCC 7403]|uniref:hypothetical protein n=1 Tax=Tumidithrix helvetica TaxID=3457545 RepID=UPI003CA6D775
MARRFLERQSSKLPFCLSQPQQSRQPQQHYVDDFATSIGVNFVGFRVLRDRIRTSNLRRARLRLKRQTTTYTQGRIDLQALARSLSSWQAHLQHGDTHRLQQSILASLKDGIK